MKLPYISHRARRTAVYLALVGLGGFGLLRLQETTDDLHDLYEAEAAEDRVEAAQQCVTSWEVRAQIRESDESHGRAGGEALIEVVQPDDPAVVELYRAVLAQRLQRASDDIADPDCDLDHARAVLDRAGRNTLRSGR